MKKLLIITPRFPYPVIGGDRLRIYMLCKHLSKNYSLTLVSLCESKDEMHIDVPNDVFQNVHRIYLSKHKSILNCLVALPTKTPLQVAYYKSKKLKQLIDKLANNHDLVLCHLIRTAQYALDLNTTKVLEMTDAISLNYMRVQQTKSKSGLKGFIYKIEQSRLNVYEKQSAEQFDLNVLVSDIDRDFLFNPTDSAYDKTLVCSNGVDLENFPYQFETSSKTVIFIGNLYSIQNYDAAYWFAENVLPKLRAHGDFNFKIIGKIRSQQATQLSRFDGTIVTGSVESVVEHALGAIAGVCPVRLAAGIQNKILEYMALGVPAISSSIGYEGLEAQKDKDILLADSEQEYVNHILRLDKDNTYAKHLAENAREYVQAHHSWCAKLSILISKMSTLKP